jgi:hypothetical protein
MPNSPFRPPIIPAGGYSWPEMMKTLRPEPKKAATASNRETDMTRFNTLCRGEPSDVINALESEPADEQELRAALQNAFERIARLERQIEERDRHIGAVPR